MADMAPEYPGGMPGLYNDLTDMIRYPDIDISGGKQGKVFVSFVVNESGEVTSVEVLRGVSRTLDAEAVRVVRKLKRWKPGVDNGHPVKVRYRLPINFKLAGG
ncbi:MAG: energy transducer TonB [Flavobacteriales bacterium]|nr:energy transducer TonB [Flavobacteriales bacterium]